MNKFCGEFKDLKWTDDDSSEFVDADYEDGVETFAWDSGKHPRYPKGSKSGGEFAPKNASKAINAALARLDVLVSNGFDGDGLTTKADLKHVRNVIRQIFSKGEMSLKDFWRADDIVGEMGTFTQFDWVLGFNVEDQEKQGRVVLKKPLSDAKMQKMDPIGFHEKLQEKYRKQDVKDMTKALGEQTAKLTAKASGQWAMSLKSAEKNAVGHYSESGYNSMNKALRSGARGGDLVASLKSALSKARLPAPMTVYRQVGSQHYEGMKVGSVFKDHGFVSTSILKNVHAPSLGGYGETNIKIRLPKGAKGMYLNGLSEVPYEREILLQAGSRFKVTKFESKVRKQLLPKKRKEFVDYIDIEMEVDYIG